MQTDKQTDRQTDRKKGGELINQKIEIRDRKGTIQNKTKFF